MDINPQTLSPLIALAAGILILLVPRLLNFIVAIYLIVIGVMGLMGRFLMQICSTSTLRLTFHTICYPRKLHRRGSLRRILIGLFQEQIPMVAGAVEGAMMASNNF